nr:hypothetical protein [Angustibacter aerolatus]
MQGTFVDVLHAHTVVVGSDTRFGVRNSGDVGTLRELGAEPGLRRGRGRRRRAGRRPAPVVVVVGARAAAQRRRRRGGAAAGAPAPGDRRGGARRPPRPRARLPDGEPLAALGGHGARRRRLRRVAAAHRPRRARPRAAAAVRGVDRHEPHVRRRRATGRGVRARPHRPRPLRRDDHPRAWWRGCARPCGSSRSTTCWCRWSTTSPSAATCSAAGWSRRRPTADIVDGPSDRPRKQREPGWTCPGAPRNE